MAHDAFTVITNFNDIFQKVRLRNENCLTNEEALTYSLTYSDELHSSLFEYMVLVSLITWWCVSQMSYFAVRFFIFVPLGHPPPFAATAFQHIECSINV